jgi:hypothetical protein
MYPSRKFLSLALLALLPLLSIPAAAFGAPICVDAYNPQYFRFEGNTIALVGSSAEYLCHVRVSNHVGDYCTYEAPGENVVGYKDYIDDLVAKGLNTFRLWVALNSSPGRDLTNTGMPYDQEQPFLFANPLWNVADGTWEEAFFDHIREVIAYAQSKSPKVIVEVTLFDPWSGDWTQGPWSSNNIFNGTGFAAEKGFVTLPSGGSCAAFNGGPRKRQIDVMKKLAGEINDLNNFYWEIANEPDVNSGDGVSGGEAAAWHDCVVQQLYSYEGTLPNGRHLIGVNYHTLDALNTIKNNSYPNSVPRIKIVNAHYVDLGDSSRYSAIELIRNWHGGPNELNRIFGFNESKITPIQTGADATRAEAWEFMLDQGGVYDHLGYQWSTSGVAISTRTYLGRLNTFLKGLNLRRAARSAGNPPTWAPSLPAYETDDDGVAGGPKIYWGAMQEGQERYVLYIHHSTKQSGAFQGYVKPGSIHRITSLDVQLGAAGIPYTVEWINPATLGVLSSTSIPGDGVRRTLTVPSYSYDIALRISNGITSIIPGDCAPY